MTPENTVQEPKPVRRVAYGYDLFLSHNWADKDWVRKLATRLADHSYNGRTLRPWLDEQVLDPGEDVREAELTTALDRSRLLVIVLSPEAMESTWVQYELQYFLASRARDEIILIRRRPCATPEVLKDLDVLDFSNDDELESNFSKLIRLVCPGPEVNIAELNEQIKDAWWESLMSGSSGYDPTPTAANSALLATLLNYDISDAAAEGLALLAFDQLGDSMLKLNPDDSYGMKMLVGEILAAAILKNERYRQVVPRYLALEPEDALHPDLSFAVLRSSSKLAEIDSRVVEQSAVWAALTKLDAIGKLFLERKAAAALGGRVVAKMRGSDLGDLLIHVLSTGGSASKIAAIAGITMIEDDKGPDYYLPEFKDIADKKTVPYKPASPPSQRLIALLDGIADYESDEVQLALKNGIVELQQNFGDKPAVYIDGWELLREEPPALQINNGPIIGTVCRITAANMEEAAQKLQVSDIACLTEPRIVDALFDRCGAFIIEQQDIASPQCRRLISRDRRFAMLEHGRMDTLADGDHIAFESDRTTILPCRR